MSYAPMAIISIFCFIYTNLAIANSRGEYGYTPDDTTEFYSKERIQATTSHARMYSGKLTMF